MDAIMVKRWKLEAAMNVESMYLLELWFSLAKCPGVVLLDHMVTLVLVF